jgi:hypothetical protein
MIWIPGHKMSFSRPSSFRISCLRQPFFCLRRSPCPEGTRRVENKLIWLLLIDGCSIEVLLFWFLITNSPYHPPHSSVFFACGKTILRLRHLLPAPGAQSPNKKKSMLAYFVASPGSNQSTSPSSQYSGISSISSRCRCLRRSSQPQPATTSQRCCHSAKHQEAPAQAGSAGAGALQTHASRIRSCAHQPHCDSIRYR